MVTRDKFVEDLKTQLDKVNVGIDKIEKKVQVVKEGSKDKLQARIKYLRDKRDAALKKLQEIKNTSNEAWQEMKQGTENIVNSLKVVLTKTMARFKKKQKDNLIIEQPSE